MDFPVFLPYVSLLKKKDEVKRNKMKKGDNLKHSNRKQNIMSI